MVAICKNRDDQNLLVTVTALHITPWPQKCQFRDMHCTRWNAPILILPSNVTMVHWSGEVTTEKPHAVQGES